MCNTKEVNGQVIPYVGKGDTFDFGGSASFAGENLTGQDFGMTIANGATSAKVIAISMARYSTLTGIQKKYPQVAVLLKDGVTSDVTVTAHDSNNPVNEFLDYVKGNPTRVVHMSMDSDKKDNFGFNIEHYQGVTPFTEARKETINLRKFVTAEQFQTDRVDIDLLKAGTPLEFSDESVILLKIAAESEIQITFGIGATASTATNLRKRAGIAKEYLVSKGML